MCGLECSSVIGFAMAILLGCLGVLGFVVLIAYVTFCDRI